MARPVLTDAIPARALSQQRDHADRWTILLLDAVPKRGAGEVGILHSHRWRGLCPTPKQPNPSN